MLIPDDDSRADERRRRHSRQWVALTEVATTAVHWDGKYGPNRPDEKELCHALTLVFRYVLPEIERGKIGRFAWEDAVRHLQHDRLQAEAGNPTEEPPC